MSAKFFEVKCLRLIPRKKDTAYRVFLWKCGNVGVMSRKSRLAVKKNRIMKLYFVVDMIGQFYGHVTLTM